IFPLWHRPSVLARAVANSDAFPTALSACVALDSGSWGRGACGWMSVGSAGRSRTSPAGHVFCNRKFSAVEEPTGRRSAPATPVLVTGGAADTGAHVLRLLPERGADVLVVDDFSTGLPARVDGLDVVDIDLAAADAEDRLSAAIEEHSVDSIIHFAAKKQVGESVEEPVMYYRQNIGALTNILAAVESTGIESLVFSSSAATYGMPDVDM